MKRITVIGPVILSRGGKEHRFEKGKPYEVADAIAEDAYLSQYLLSKENIVKKVPRKTAKEAKDVASKS